MNNDLNNILNNYGFRLLEAGEDQQQVDPNQQAQDPQQVQPQDQSIQPQNDEDIDPNNDPSINPNPTIADDKFKEVETIERLNVIKSLIRLSAILDKIKNIKFQVTKFDLNETILMVNNVIDNIDIFETDDIIKFRDILLDRLDPRITMLKSKITECEEYLTEDEIDFLYSWSHNTLKDNNIESIKDLKLFLNEIKSHLYKLKKDLESDDTIHFNYFGRQYSNRQALLMVKDSINMIDIIINDRSKLTILFNKYKFNKKISNVKDISEYKNSIWFVNLDTLTNFSEKDHLIYTFFIRNMFVNNFMLYSKDLVVDYKLLIAGNTQVDLIKEILSNILKNSLKIEMSSNDITTFLNKYRIKDDILININSKSDTIISHLEFDNEEDLRIFNSLKAASLFMYNNFINSLSIFSNKFNSKIFKDSYTNYSRNHIGYEDSVILDINAKNIISKESLLTYNHIFRGLQFLFSIPKNKNL